MFKTLRRYALLHSSVCLHANLNVCAACVCVCLCVCVCICEFVCLSGFLSMFLFRRLSTEIDSDELKIRSLGRQLVNYSNTNDIFRSHSDQIPLATMKILKRWKNTNKRLEEGAMVNHPNNHLSHLYGIINHKSHSKSMKQRMSFKPR